MLAMPGLCLLLFALIFTPTPVKGHYQVTSSRQPVVAAPGDDVVLQCLVEPQLDTVDMTVEWSRPDAKRRAKGVEYVHLYRDNREVLDMKSSSYHGRTALFADGLRHGNISLIITNVTTADEGEYKCFIPKLQGNAKSSVVRLVIDQSSNLKPNKTVPSETHLHHEATRQNYLNGGVPRSRSFTPLILICVSLIFNA
ncbi:myelin-oligodendrocyte glycoprotein-like isoform X1 [Poeciliopsis prolifica]|uniref:myelin-oligodendrocyte glycoprotein-like isoform X1 n=2 Tax=Poeciliopsis prolifica TaxID=188132 RepID=UPI002414176A|nr:myelin-oligodendrocyte glycoprotein-like isoform X1 [Poeciliopsis prolifica]